VSEAEAVGAVIGARAFQRLARVGIDDALHEDEGMADADVQDVGAKFIGDDELDHLVRLDRIHVVELFDQHVQRPR
jgi:hypothetical protein